MQKLAVISSVLAVGALVWSGYQGQRIDALEARVESLTLETPRDLGLFGARDDMASPVARSRPSIAPPLGAKTATTRATDVRAPHAEENTMSPKEAVIEALESYDPVVRDRLKAVVQEEQERLDKERDEQRHAIFARLQREQVDALALKADMTPSQTEVLHQALDNERSAVRTIFEQARANFSFGAAREKLETLRAETDASIKKELEDDQYSEYLEMRENDMGRWGRRGPPAQSEPKRREE